MSTIALTVTDQPISRLERLFALFGLLFVLRALTPMYQSLDIFVNFAAYANAGREFDVAQGSALYQLESASIYLIAGMIVYRYRDVALDLLWRNKALVLFVLFAVVSVIWSADPGTSIRRSTAFTATTVFGVYFAVRYSHREFFELLAIAMALTVLETTFLAVFVPSIGVHHGFPHEGAWRGFIGQKNDAGRLMVLATLVAFIAWRSKIGDKWLGWPAVLLAMVAVIFTDSKTSLSVFALLIVSLPMLHMLRRSSLPPWLRVALIGLMAAAPLAYLVATSYDTGLELIGRDATLTGRTNIWENAIEVGLTQPWLGFGYRTFWLADNPFTWRMANPGHGHNSYLDIWVELGTVGLAIFVVTLLVAIRRAYWRLTNSNDGLGLWYTMYLLMFMVFGATSFTFPQHGTIEWVLYTVVTLHLTPGTSGPRRVSAQMRGNN